MLLDCQQEIYSSKFSFTDDAGVLCSKAQESSGTIINAASNQHRNVQWQEEAEDYRLLQWNTEWCRRFGQTGTNVHLQTHVT